MCDSSRVEATTRNTKWESQHAPLLIGCSSSTSNEAIVLSHSEFVIGRSLTASYNIPHVCVSKLHCVFQLFGEKWTVSDMSKFGTYVNNKRIEKNKPTDLLDGDELRFGLSDIRYIFFSSSSLAPPNKKPKLNHQFEHLEEKRQDLHKEMKKLLQSRSSVSGEMWEKLKTDTTDKVQQSDTTKEIEQLKEKHAEEMRLCKEGIKKFFRPKTPQTAEEEEEKINGDKTDSMQKYNKAKEIEQLEAKHAEEMRLCKEKLAKENKMLEKKLKEMQRKLEEKEREENLLNKKLQEKEEQRLKDLEQQDAKNKALLEALRAEVVTKEETIKLQLETEIKKLQSEKEKIENNIKCEQLIKEGETAENIKRLTEELDKVKAELANTEGKKLFLEKELENTANRTQEKLTESSLKAKQEVLQNFGQLVESELQCSICNELFVTATTLNCTHTFCHMCISLWKKKKRDCPVCRAPIKSENRSIVLDTFIDRIVENLSKDLQNRRQEIVEERQVQELLSVKSEASTSRQQGRRGRSRNANAPARVNTGNIEPIVITSDSSSDSEMDIDLSMLESDDSSSSSIEGDPDAYYGGHGICFSCGRRGHWARGCPFR